MSARVHPITLEQTDTEERTRCPCSTNFDGHCTCIKGCCFTFCVLLICGYIATLVMGVIQFGTCIGNTLPVYMLAGASICIVFLFIFTCWLCNRCIDVKSMVALSVFFLTILVFGSIVGIFLVNLGICDKLTRDVAIVSSCPVWLVLFIVLCKWCYKNFLCVTNDQGRPDCVEDPINSGCPCYDCEEGARMIVNCLDYM